MKTKITIFLLMLLLSPFTFLSAQVTIGSAIRPEKGALLDLKEHAPVADNRTSDKGLLLPRVNLDARNSLSPIIADNDPDIANLKRTHTGLMVYNLSTTSVLETDPVKILKPGIYTWNGTLWTMYIDNTQRMDSKFFYMPSFNLPIHTLGTRTFNLYNEYARQFQKAGNSAWASSNTSLTEVSAVYTAHELDYIVVDMQDNSTIKVNNISPLGVLNYDVLSTTAHPDFYINIILVVK